MYTWTPVTGFASASCMSWELILVANARTEAYMQQLEYMTSNYDTFTLSFSTIAALTSQTKAAELVNSLATIYSFL